MSAGRHVFPLGRVHDLFAVLLMGFTKTVGSIAIAANTMAIAPIELTVEEPFGDEQPG